MSLYLCAAVYQVAFQMPPGFPPGKFPLRFLTETDDPMPYYPLDTGGGAHLPPSASPFPGRKTITKLHITDMALGDLNLDGNTDVVILGDRTAGGIEVLLGNGDGTFGPSHLYDVPNAFGNLSVGDFNGDGVPDLLSGNGSGILFGNGDGTFQAVRSTGVTGVASSSGVAVGDFNGDGRLDLATLSGTKVSVWLGRGDGTFASPVTVTLSATANGIFAGRFQPRRGFDDLIAYAEGGPVSIVFSNGDGTFQTPKTPFRLPDGLDITAVGDFNGDGAADIAVSGSFYPGDFFVRLGNGDGTFRNPIKTDLPEYVIAVRDLNGDGNLDILGADGANKVFVCFGVGDGTFRAGPLYDLGIYHAANPYIGLGDVNRDGVPDIISVAYNRDTVSIHLGNGDGSFESLRYPNGAESAVADWAGTIALDLDKDGHTDLAAIAGDSVYVLWNDNGAFVETPQLIGASKLPVAAGDFNGDGWPDLASGGTVYLGGPGRTFRALKTTDLGMSLSAVATADFNRDGRSDLAAVDRFSQLIKVFPGQPDGSLGSPWTIKSSGYPTAVTIGDVNGDRIPDIVTDWEVLLGKGDGTFQVSQRFPISGIGFDPVVLADFDRDGTLDIAAGVGRDLFIYRGNGDGTFHAPSKISYEGNITALGAADIDGDGAPDLVLSVVYADVVYLRNRGDGTFYPEVRFIGGAPQVNSMNVFDANGDGRPDIVAGTAILDRKR
jgi:hypothetical protein